MDWGMQPGNTNEHRFLKSLFLAKGKKKKKGTPKQGRKLLDNYHPSLANH
jgi:hypothetical protein